MRIGAPRAGPQGTPFSGAAAPAPPPPDARGLYSAGGLYRSGPRPGAPAESRDPFFGNNGIVESWTWASRGTQRSSSPASHALEEFPRRRAILSSPQGLGCSQDGELTPSLEEAWSASSSQPLRCVTLIRALDLSGPK